MPLALFLYGLYCETITTTNLLLPERVTFGTFTKALTPTTALELLQEEPQYPTIHSAEWTSLKL